MKDTEMKETKTEAEMFSEDRLNKGELKEATGGIGFFEGRLLKQLSSWTHLDGNNICCNYCVFRQAGTIDGGAVMKLHLRISHDIDCF